MPALAAPTPYSARGELRVEHEHAPLHVTLAHAYLISGPDAFEPAKTTRSIVFTADEHAADIADCTRLGCAQLSQVDGLKVDIATDGPVAWWAHIAPMQYSGTSAPSDLTLRIDTPDHVAGTFMLDNSGVKTTIEFDAGLVKAFDR